jgi:hypothetical protein
MIAQMALCVESISDAAPYHEIELLVRVPLLAVDTSVNLSIA